MAGYNNKPFREYMAESGQQSTLDQIERNLGYGAAEGQYLSQGYYGSGPGSPGYAERQAIEDQKRAAADLQAQQEKKQSDYLSRFQNYISGLEPLSAISQRYATEIGLPTTREEVIGLGQQVSDLEKQLYQLPEQIKGETRGFDVNAAQLARLTEARKEPVTENLIETARSAERAGIRQQSLEQDVASYLSSEVANRQYQMMPWTVEAEMISDAAARAVTLFTTTSQNELSVLLQKLQNQGALDQMELQRTIDLAQAEQEYTLKKDYYLWELQNKPKAVGTQTTKITGQTEAKPTTSPYTTDLANQGTAASSATLRELGDDYLGAGGSW